jgi:hypothetical protein
MLGKLRRKHQIKQDIDVPGNLGAKSAAETVITVPDGLGTEPAVGWRAWKVAATFEGHVRIVSPDLGGAWPGAGAWHEGLLCGDCAVKRNQDCHCGINAFTDQDKLKGTQYAPLPVIGVVELAGEVRQFADGWRGQHARPTELHVFEGEDELARQLQQSYGCPVLADRPRQKLPKRWRLTPSEWALLLVFPIMMIALLIVRLTTHG